jgi:anti-sigma factor RsiW
MTKHRYARGRVNLQRIQTDERLIRQYLLGELPEHEQIAVEARFFADDAFFEQLVAAEKELIGRYLRGDLSAEYRVRFQRRYLTVDYRRKLVESAMVESAMESLRLRGGSQEAGSSVRVVQDRSWWWRRLLSRLRSFQLRSRR